MNMKKHIFLSIALFLFVAVQAQDKKAFYEFTDVINLDASEIKDQCRTGTCWSFATSSFLESELIRMNKGSVDLSEMYNVRMTYPKKVENYLRYQGKAQFGPGSLSHDVINVMAEYGVVPESAYNGLPNGDERHNHGQMDAVLEGMAKALVENNRGNLNPSWSRAVDGVLDAYLGEAPESFEVDGKSFTPAEYRDHLGLKAEDYVSFSSFSHHPFYAPFVLEVPDNFSQGSFFNVPIDDLLSMTEAALRSGYTVAWDADVSEAGFSFRNGMALLIDGDVPKDERFKKEHKEPEVTQEERQANFNNFQTTDDHLMHITGMAKDQFGNPYFIIKNSWGDGNLYGGKQYISYAYFKMKTVGILLHRDGVSKAVGKKLK